MVAEGGAAVAVQAELVLVARILGDREESFREIGLGEGPKILREVIFFLKKWFIIFAYACLHVNASAGGGQKRASDAPELMLREV